MLLRGKGRKTKIRGRNPMRFNNTEVLKVALVFTMEKPEWSCWSESGR